MTEEQMEKEIERLDNSWANLVDDLEAKVERLQFVLTSCRGQNDNLIQENERLRDEVKKLNATIDDLYQRME